MPWTYELADLFSETHAPIKSLCFSPDGAVLATADVRRTVRVLGSDGLFFERRYRSGWERLRALDHVRGLAFSEDGSTLYLASGNRVRSIDWRSGEERTIGSRKPMLCFMITCPISVAVSNDGDLAIGYDDGYVEIQTPGGNGLRTRAAWSDNAVAAFSGFLPSGLLAVSDRYSISIWDPSTGVNVARLQTPKVYAMAVSPVQNELAVRTLDRVSIWDVDSGALVMEAPAPSGLPTVQFSNDGRMLVVGDREGFTMISRDGPVVGRTISDSPVLSLAISKGDGRIAAGTAAGTVLFAMPELLGSGC